ncbi:MAG: PIG-L family deacetylase [Erysipelotrichia bacterium]|nr:PIG-L family deacetylase [Erysipelotrichia bacterium]NCC54840.1 PIG-L family deacetylase [Erysipelotrichia bacterium]
MVSFSQHIDKRVYDSLMVVAHPDDETIWGADHLINGNYVVVCLTNQDNKTRSKEFTQIMKASHSQGLILAYPDKTNGKRDDWQSSKKKIQNDLAYLIKKYPFKQIVTHNPEGEYGHKHHIMTSQIVTNIVKENHELDRLYYFGKYVKKRDMQKMRSSQWLQTPLSAPSLTKKKQLTKLYSSQAKVMKHLKHMFAYENWLSYNEWYKE